MKDHSDNNNHDEPKDDVVQEDIQDDVVFEDSDEEGIEKGANDKLKQLREKIARLEKEKQEYLIGWQRARADYANLQKTTEEDKKKLKGLFKEGFIAELIPVVDSFLMAMGNKDAWEKVDPNWRKGVEYIFSQLMSILESHELVLFGAEGDAFDPMNYEAVQEEETEDAGKDHTVAKVIQKGFKLADSVIRPARVVVYTKK